MNNGKVELILSVQRNRSKKQFQSNAVRHMAGDLRQWTNDMDFESEDQAEIGKAAAILEGLYEKLFDEGKVLDRQVCDMVYYDDDEERESTSGLTGTISPEPLEPEKREVAVVKRKPVHVPEGRMRDDAARYIAALLREEPMMSHADLAHKLGVYGFKNANGNAYRKGSIATLLYLGKEFLAEDMEKI